MGMYCIGDIHGCHAEFQALLQALDFSPSRDTLYVLGDLVNRGPDSAGVVRNLMALEGSAYCLLGNHDVHLLAVAAGARKPNPKDTLKPLLAAPDAPQMLDWLRRQPLALYANQCLMVHAGVQPQWDVAQTLACAHEISQLLRAPDWAQHMAQLFGNLPDLWDDSLRGMERWRCSLNSLTRMRMMDRKGRINFTHKLGSDARAAREGLLPWFDVAGRRTALTTVAFGHWSTLGLLQRPHLLGLDTSCVWGGQLTAAEILHGGVPGRIVQVPRQPHAGLGG
ncbi:MAG: symmetrical bis(5'-nucleosyl)-tetraphosphatase [Brachymonas sp.]|nr:symmetrical bis(5'-nucleosyl)-tetraphosphatase [Brachymonas sp.]